MAIKSCMKTSSATIISANGGNSIKPTLSIWYKQKIQWFWKWIRILISSCRVLMFSTGSNTQIWDSLNIILYLTTQQQNKFHCTLNYYQEVPYNKAGYPPMALWRRVCWQPSGPSPQLLVSTLCLQRHTKYTCILLNIIRSFLHAM